MHVKDKQTAVIGGLIDQTREQTASGVPVLKDIPVLGRLFRNSQQSRRNVTEMFLFITPHVIRTDDEMDETTRRLRESSEGIRKNVKEPIPLLPATAADTLDGGRGERRPAPQAPTPQRPAPEGTRPPVEGARSEHPRPAGEPPRR